MAFDFSKVESVKLNDQQAKELENKLQNQEKRVSRPLAKDENLEVWKTPINDRALIYIPNFTRINADGVPELATERAFIYSIRTASEYLQLRDTTGLSGLTEVGISGNDPLREVEQENWEIYNAKVEAQAKKLNIDKKSESLKDFRSEILNNFSVKPSNEYYYFPIVHLVTSKDAQGHSSVQLDDVIQKDGRPVMKPYLYRISKAQFDKMFATIVSTLPKGETLGGRLYQFSYITGKATSELKNPARDSGLAFTPNLMQSTLDEGTKKALDSVAEFMTLDYLRENVYELMLLPDAVHAEVAKDAHARIEQELNLIRLQAVTESTSNQNLITGGQDAGGTAVESLMKNLGAGTSVENTETGTPTNNAGGLSGLSFGGK